MDAILFSCNPSMVAVDDAVKHLAVHNNLYWEVGFKVSKNTVDSLKFPIFGYMHISGGQVEYRAKIKNIIPYTTAHYDDAELAESVKPKPWLKEWQENVNNVQSYNWRSILVIDEIDPFSRDTRKFQKPDGTFVSHPPQGYIRILDPSDARGRAKSIQLSNTPQEKSPVRSMTLAEQNLEDFVVHQLEAIEPGLHLVGRQISTPAGRLDLLCKDSEGKFVVVELKREQGTDRVVGQILRYMGWVMIHYRVTDVRGIIIVGKKDPLLDYAVEAASNIQAKEFCLSFQ